MTTAEQYWEGFYLDRDQVWSGQANPLLVREVSALPPGAALDLGCAEGADAVWLAGRGWRVVGADVSATALARAAARAEEAGVADRITWERHDLAETFPAGTFDLVSAQFLHSPVERDGERDAVLRRAAAAVADGGVLLVVGHAGWPTWVTEPPADIRFPTTGDVLAALRLDDRWEVELEELVERELTGPEGQAGSRVDNVLRVRRR
ncbi:class I SAM-dependent methyltransferase [Saccharothrix australiensis]|uniref:Methyltransferase family protein n=1 Tax=Saccharothrix australiensis TaxID=2072 RepID=A0A495W1F0_9PSEU|nr:class I SAM-dependent methyltransferase [Saccharothrix australiensis]RKT54950.1 methyltransferase family protein [Saccharothrix australiensis]